MSDDDVGQDLLEVGELLELGDVPGPLKGDPFFVRSGQRVEPLAGRFEPTAQLVCALTKLDFRTVSSSLAP